MKVGFIGLGMMGKGMAANLQKAGHRLVVYDIRRAAAEPYLAKGAVGLFLKGQDVGSELTEATRYWAFEAQLTASLSHPDGRILQVERLQRVRKV